MLLHGALNVGLRLGLGCERPNYIIDGECRDIRRVDIVC
jgi:hypothetical protein